MTKTLSRVLWMQVACLGLWPLSLLDGVPDPEANLLACRQGRSSCDRSRLSLSELTEVARAHHVRNVADCRNGLVACDRSKDEILHRARLSPVRQTQRLAPEEIERLWTAARETLRAWTGRLRRETGDAFPEEVTAFRAGMRVHGRFGKPCPECGAPVQRIVFAENETNYCAACQTAGRLLADRALSRLLHEDWPRTLEELEARRGARG